MIEEFAEEHSVGIVSGSEGADRTSLAYAKLDEMGRAEYEFDLLWEVPELPPASSLAHLHTGSLAATLEPGGTDVLRAVKAMAILGTVSYDPNARPAIMGSPEDVLPRIEELVSLADVVKASDEDIAWLFGEDTPVEEVMRRWSSQGPGLVVVTRGPWGAYARLSAERDMLVIDPLNVEVTDTVGAGDSFMGGPSLGPSGRRVARQRGREETAAGGDVERRPHRPPPRDHHIGSDGEPRGRLRAFPARSQ